VLKPVDTIKIDAQNMESATNQKRHSIINKAVTINLPFQKGKTISVSESYVAKPEQAMYFVGSEEKKIS
jgi:aminopeptidase N